MANVSSWLIRDQNWSYEKLPLLVDDPPSTNSSSKLENKLEEKLEQVKTLLERGLISEEEAAKKRQSILDDL